MRKDERKKKLEERIQNFARVHSEETFGTVDGPGIRFVLFLQGCMLKCKYCHNRDTWDIHAGKIFTVEQILEKIERSKNYIESSNGGVTVTGGEPLLQVKFLIELFTKLKEQNIHTCIDTSGMVDITDDIKKLLSLTDLVLLDIKHIDDEKCKKLVGMSNKKELNFAQYLSDNNIKMWIRQVIVPGFTDDEEDLKNLKKFIGSLNNVDKVELLPYHSMGRYKWEKLNLEYPLKDVLDCTDEDIKRAKQILFD
jgi:pyruvate formate lyase activating enzyme